MMRESSAMAMEDIRYQKGITLIELLFVIAVVSVFTMLAVSLYREYRGEVVVLGGLVVAAPAKESVMEAYISSGSWPNSNGEAGLKDPGDYRTNYIDELIVGQGGQITLSYSYPGFGFNNTLVITPEVNKNNVIWDCSRGSLDTRYRPDDCQ